MPTPPGGSRAPGGVRAVTLTTNRPYAGEADYQRMRDLLLAVSARSAPAAYCTVGDLDWWRHFDEPAAIDLAHLWFAGDVLAGFAWPKDDQVDLLSHPEHRGVEAAMLRWAETERSAAGAGSEPVVLRAWAYGGDITRTALLRANGYERTVTCFVCRAQSLDAPIPAASLPPGYAIRHMRDLADVEARVGVHRAVFTRTRLSVSRYGDLMRAPTYRADLDLVAVAPDGTFGAFAIVWLDTFNRLGVFEPVGTHPAHRRRGLGRALLHEGLRRLQDLGAGTAHVNSRHDDPAPNCLYESAGFSLVDRNYAWSKLLRG